MRLTTGTRARLRLRQDRTCTDFSTSTEHAEILKRLEATKTYGLVADYLLSWSGLAGQHVPRVTVWGMNGTPSDIMQHYITRLLQGLVSDKRIEIAGG